MIWRLDAAIARLQHWDERVCVRVNRGARQRPVVLLLQGISWLGNGIFWYALMLALLLAETREAAMPVLHMAFVGAVCTCCYKMVKHSTVRSRPYQVNPLVSANAAALDRFSFPSGHTLHAIAFTLIACSYYPGLWMILAPFTLLTAVSRVALGLHYPSDVIAGGALGGLIAGASFLIA
ncbi:MAG TPA: phosphatase PAP2 family protein [Burkholderiales bacterium]|nr:phosphatase PAP2 family protein [Burkholderiales bacterium]